MSKRLARRKMPKRESKRVKAFALKQAVKRIRARWGEKTIRLASTDNKQTDQTRNKKMMNEMNVVVALLIIAILLAAIMIVLVEILVEQRVKERLEAAADRVYRGDDQNGHRYGKVFCLIDM